MGVKILISRSERDLGKISSAVAEAVAQSQLLGADGFSSAVSSLFRALEALRGTDTVETIAAALVEDTAAYAIAAFAASQLSVRNISSAELLAFTRQSINSIREISIQNNLEISSHDIYFPLEWVFSKNSPGILSFTLGV